MSARKDDLGEQPKPGGDSEKDSEKDLVEPGLPSEAVVDDLAGRPDTPVPEQAELEAAMVWAFTGEEIAPELLITYARHARMLLEGNRRVNLTALIDPREIAAKHYLDSWRVTRFMGFYGKNLLDLGSGAGFPGLPVALAESDVRMTLLDSTQKRVTFMQESIEALGLEKRVSAVWARAEDHLARNNYDAVLVRAVSSVRENVRTLRKVRHSHKDLVMWKGPSWSREARAGEREAERLGFRLDTVYEYTLPSDLGKRAILVYRAPGGHGS